MADKSDVKEPRTVSENQESFVKRWGAIITLSGGDQCKGGAYSYPGALDRYERALGLPPDEAWLAKRLLSLDWDGKCYVWCSLLKMSEEAGASYTTILRLMKSLELKGYVQDMGQHSDGQFSQVKDWNIRGLLKALEAAIKCDPTTEVGRGYADIEKHPITMADFFTHGGGPKKGKPFDPFETFTTPKEVNDWNNANGDVTPWAIEHSTSVPAPQKREPIEHTCSRCGETFFSGSRNPKTRCKKCRSIVKRQSLNPLSGQYD